MRPMHLFVALAALLTCGMVAAQPAEAGGRYDRGYSYYPAYQPVYYKKAYPRKRYHAKRPVVAAYIVTDPYAYRYEPRGYYPYYDSGYWRPQCSTRNSCVPTAFQPPYWKAWGYEKRRRWNNRAFHSVYHGRIKPWHW